MLVTYVAQAAATWFIVVGKPATAYSAYVVSWIVFFSLVLLACGDSVLRAAIAIDEEVAAQAGLVRRLALEYQLTQLRGSAMSESPTHTQTAQSYIPDRSLTPSPKVDLGLREQNLDAEATQTLDDEEQHTDDEQPEFHTPSRQKLREPHLETDRDKEEEMPLPMNTVEGILPIPSQSFHAAGSERRSTEQMSRTPSPSPPEITLPTHEQFPGQVLRNDVLALLIEEIADDNSNPVKLRFFGMPCSPPSLY